MFQVKNEVERATVYIYGTIGDDWWSPEDANRAKDFAKTLDGLSPKPVDIRIDSSGGDVYEGFAIASAIQRYEGDTHAYVDGMAASAASYIALMADRVTMNDYAVLMIHNAWAMAVGDRDELRDMANRLEALDGTIAGIISRRSVLELDEVRAAMDAETWYTADEALVAGMCDEVVETEQRVAASIDRAIAERFRNIPSGIAVGDAGVMHEPVQPVISITANNLQLSDLVSGRMEAASTLASVSCVSGPVQACSEDPENGASHALPTIGDNEARDAEGAILLGNRVYRKEN